MATRVGTKGQVVIEQRIREELGIEPGMLAVQRVVGDHVELRFVAGKHRRSLAGAARPFMKRDRPDLWDPDAFKAALEDAWGAEVAEKMRRLNAQSAEDEPGGEQR